MGTIHNSVRSDGKEISDYQSFSLIVQTALLCVVTMQVWLGEWGEQVVRKDWVGSLSGRKGKEEGGKMGRDHPHYRVEKGGG